MDGYRASDQWKEHPLTPWAFTMLNAMGDLFDIIPAVSKNKRPSFDKMSLEQLRQYSNKNGHCSALIRITPGLEEVFVGHTSWFTYSAMLRIMKSYEFSLRNEASRAKKTVFSSYPGTLSSLDDMYLMSGSDLIMTQTTNSIYNHSLWDLVVPQSLLAWQRVRAANQLSDSGPEWFKVVGTHNSGSYNNQYMILGRCSPHALTCLRACADTVCGGRLEAVQASQRPSSEHAVRRRADPGLGAGGRHDCPTGARLLELLQRPLSPRRVRAVRIRVAGQAVGSRALHGVPAGTAGEDIP